MRPPLSVLLTRLYVRASIAIHAVDESPRLFPARTKVIAASATGEAAKSGACAPHCPRRNTPVLGDDGCRRAMKIVRDRNLLSHVLSPLVVVGGGAPPISG